MIDDLDRRLDRASRLLGNHGDDEVGDLQ